LTEGKKERKKERKKEEKKTTSEAFNSTSDSVISVNLNDVDISHYLPTSFFQVIDVIIQNDDNRELANSKNSFYIVLY
jgi:hypothetical protein